MEMLQPPADGSSVWVGMSDLELIMPDGRHRARLLYDGEPPHDDSCHRIEIDGVPASGYAWRYHFACTPDSHLLTMSRMEKRIGRKITVFDLGGRRYFVLFFYMGDFCFRQPHLDGAGSASEQRSYTFNGTENWLAR